MIGRDGYLNQIDGMLFGDDPEEGLVIGQRFVHPKLRFEFSVPEGFLLRNRPDKVVAQHPSGAAIVFDIDNLGRQSLGGYLHNVWAKGVPLRQSESIQVGGRQAVTAVARGRGQQGAVDVRFLAILGDGGKVYRFLYITPLGETARLSEALRRSTYSFRTLSAQDAAAINAMRLLIVDARPGDSVASLASTLPFGRYNEDWFRVLNDLQPGQPLPSDQRLKVVVR
jgi:predicted Zn-dependent protease